MMTVGVDIIGGLCYIICNDSAEEHLAWAHTCRECPEEEKTIWSDMRSVLRDSNKRGCF